MKLARKNRYVVPLALGAICFSQWLPHLRASDTDGGSYGQTVYLPAFVVTADPIDDNFQYVSDFSPGYFEPYLDSPDSNGGGGPGANADPTANLNGHDCGRLKEKAELAKDAYRKDANGNYQPTGSGNNVPITATNAVQLANGDPATLAQRSDDPASGFHASVYINTETGKVTVAFAGTEGQTGDLLTDALNAMSILTTQYEKAMDLGRYVQETFGSNVEFVGHSLGGGLATAAAAATGLYATTYNAAGVTEQVVASQGATLSGAADRITAVSVEGEILTAFQDIVNTPLIKSEWEQLNIPVPPAAIGQRVVLQPYNSNPWMTLDLHRITSVLASFPC